MYSLHIDIDRLNGKIKTTRGGDYRFSLIVRDASANAVAIMHGFRVDKNFMHVMPPTATYGRSYFSVALLSKDFEATTISTIKSIVQAETPQVAP